MKKLFALILVLAMVFGLSACSLRDVTESVMPTPAPTARPTPKPTPEPAPEPSPEPEPESPYKTVLDKYYNALSEGWGPATMMENGINYMLSMYGDTDMLADTGYYIGDLDGDGKDELVIGNIGENDFVVNMIYDFYTLGEDELMLQFSGSERNRFYMCDNGLYINEGSSSAAHSETIYYRFENSTFLFDEALIFDSEMDPEANWFYTVDYNMARERMKPVTSQEATDIIEERVSHITRPNYIPFTDYPNQEW